MRRNPSAPIFGTVIRLALVTAFVTISVVAHAQVVVGPNVNMGGGPASFTPPSTIIGDPFLNRQNEPSIALSSRNPCHLLAGANDYRAVELEEAAGEVGDAWLGVFKSFDCGATWTSTLLPGHKLDTSTPASPIFGLAAAADPTVRAGTSGLFYYSGIAFNRGEGQPSKVFVARFIDNNNKDGSDPIQYLGARQIDLGTSGQFLDKPWLVADIARNGSVCTINNKTVPAGPVYLVYTSFVGGSNNVHSKILFSKSTDCGATWSSPSKLSESVARNQGTNIAIDPGTGAIHIAWREFSVAGDSSTRDSIMVVRSTNGGQTFTKAQAITPNGYAMQPFDQVSSPLSFRTNAYPTIAVLPAAAAGQPGRVFVAWSARGFKSPTPDQSLGDARIVMSWSDGGSSWSTPAPADPYGGSGHQIMPSLAFAGGKMALAYYDLRDDAAALKAGRFEDLVFEYGQEEFDACMVTPGANTPLGFGAVLNCIVNSVSRLSLRHTLDMRAAIFDGPCLSGGACASSSLLGSQKVSRYPEGNVSGSLKQLQYNRPNLPLFSKGRLPFIGDYIDVAGESFVATATGGWAWNTGLTTNRPSPVFHVAWTDNRNVGTPPGVNPNWEPFMRPIAGAACVAGSVGVRNQDVYTAQLRPSLVVSAPQNSKRVAGLQRSFVVVAQNATDIEHHYELQAITTPSDLFIASFDQFSGFGVGSPLQSIFVTIPRKSTISRTLFVSLKNPTDPNTAPDVLVPVKVTQLPDPSGPGSGLSPDTVYLNPDFENPDFENPDFENVELHNPDFENPDFENPDFENPDFENFSFTSAAVKNPDFENPDFENPDFENPDFENPDFENPDFENPDFENPDFENPDFENPDFENATIDVSDTTWPVRNNGNTTSAYKANVFVNEAPDGINYQLVVRKIFTAPVALCTAGQITLAQVAQSVPLVNIDRPDIAADPRSRAFNDPDRDNATFYLAPGERGLVTLRAYCKHGESVIMGDGAVQTCQPSLLEARNGQTALGVVAQGANCSKSTIPNDLGDEVGGYSECIVDEGPPKDIYDPIPPTVAVVDPTLTAPETTIVVTDADNNGVENVNFGIDATDNIAVAGVTCASATTITFVGKVGDRFTFMGAFPVGTTGVTCTAKDVRANPAPNSAAVDFFITVKDVTPPSFAVAPGPNAGAPYGPGNPAEALGPNGAVVTYTNPSATDSNGGPVNVECASSDGNLHSGSLFPIGTTPIDCVATDDSSNAIEVDNMFAITVADHTRPVISAHADVTAEATGAAGAVVTYTLPVTSDLVDGAGVASCAPASGGLFALGTTTVTCNAVDAHLNTAQATTFQVRVVDTTAPVLGAVANITTNATGPTGAIVSYVKPSATDAVGATVSCMPASGTTFPIGTSTVLCTASDAAGNSATKSFTVTVNNIAVGITASANPNTLLWSPNKTMTPVTVSGVATGTGLTSITFKVVDEYGKVQPTGAATAGAGGNYSFITSLEAYRNGNDADGRLYTITVTGVWTGGRTASASTTVRVPHNQ